MSEPTLRDEDYRRAGFGGRLAIGARPVLLLIDPAVAYVDPAAPLFADCEPALKSMERLLAAARAAGVPVIFTRVLYAPGGADGGLFFRKVPALTAFETGNPHGEFAPSLTPQDGELVICKQYPSAFFGTSLASTLHGMGVDTVIMAGFSTSGCIRATALDALCHGFVPVAVADACGDRSAEAHQANLFDIAAKIGEVADEARAVAFLSRASAGA